jgi:phage terminase small subunit
MPDHPAPPGHLSKESRALWGELAEAYDFEPQELKTLRLALEALDRSAQARRALKRLGVTYMDRFGQPHARPEVAIERDSRAAFVKMVSGLDLPTEDAPPTRKPRNIQGEWEQASARRRRRSA